MEIQVGITLDNKSANEATVRIPAGSIFEVAKTEYGVQNVAIVSDHFFKVPARSKIKVIVVGRCLNRRRAEPKSVSGRVTPFRYAGNNFDQESIWHKTLSPQTSL